MTYLNKSDAFIVVENKRGSLSPSYVWEASNEADYMQRIQASNPRSGDSFNVFETVIEDDQNRNGTCITILRKENYLANDPDSLCKRIHDCAARLGWYVDDEQ